MNRRGIDTARGNGCAGGAGISDGRRHFYEWLFYIPPSILVRCFALPHSACRRWSLAGPLLHLTTIRLRRGISEMCVNDFDGHAGMMTLADPEIRYAILYTL